jgi:hypothetical protein
MSRYRWLRPSKCLESMDYFPSCKGVDYAGMAKQLFDAVSRGDIRAMLDDELVPKAHISIYLSLYARATPEQELHTLPPDLAISYDDLCAVFDRANSDNRKPGRPRREGSGWSVDRRLAADIHKMLAGPPQGDRKLTATGAARILVNEGRVPGAGTDESRIKRLVNEFRKHYSS